jgi:hypothetical protein
MEDHTKETNLRGKGLCEGPHHKELLKLHNAGNGDLGHGRF